MDTYVTVYSDKETVGQDINNSKANDEWREDNMNDTPEQTRTKNPIYNTTKGENIKKGAQKPGVRTGSGEISKKPHRLMPVIYEEMTQAVKRPFREVTKIFMKVKKPNKREA